MDKITFTREFALTLGNALAEDHASLVAKETDPHDKRQHKTTLGQFNQALMFLAEHTPVHVTGDVWIVPSKGTGRPHRIHSNTDKCDCELGLLSQTCWASIAVNLWTTAVAEAEAVAKREEINNA